ncbi:MAG TPA: 50S ribosomal protein L10 [Patescibacteria group bacterium]|nr:50S ribosomal protein L10 [Patescibacteria group bacterium]
MVKQDKVYTVQNLTEKLKQAKAVVLADYHGLKVSQMAELRRNIKKNGGEFEVIKNTLLGRAAEESQIKIEPDVLQGPTVVLWAYEDQISPLKTLVDFTKANNLPKIKFGLLDQVIIPVEKIKQLASLPSKEELKAKFVGVLQSPLYGLNQALSWNLKKLVFILKAKGGEENDR